MAGLARRTIAQWKFYVKAKDLYQDAGIIPRCSPWMYGLGGFHQPPPETICASQNGLINLPQVIRGDKSQKYLSCQQLDGVIYLHLAIVVFFFWWGGFPDPITKNSSWSDQTRQWMVAISFNQKWGKRAWIEDTKPMRSFKLSFEVEVLCCSFEGSLKFIFENFTEFLNPPKAPRLWYTWRFCVWIRSFSQ